MGICTATATYYGYLLCLPAIVAGAFGCLCASNPLGWPYA